MQHDLFEAHDLEDEILEEFITGLYDNLEAIENDLVILERDPHNNSAINSLFRAMHTIKGNCRMCFIDPFCTLTHTMEEVVSDMRAGRTVLSNELKEALLLALDYLKNMAERLAQVGSFHTEKLKAIEIEFSAMVHAPAAEVVNHALSIIKTLSGLNAKHLPAKPQANTALLSTPRHESADLTYFQQLALFIDGHSPFWDNRTTRILETALAINAELSHSVDEKQLSTAVYLHDLGMTLIPEQIINKEERLNPLEEKVLHKHVMLGAELIKRMQGWEAAAEMVQHHHERVDGTGYPGKLKDDAISMGGQILAVCDTFFSLTTERADRSYKRSLIRAITEINKCMGTQFKPEIVNAFNTMIKKRYISNNED
ncbi:MAG TPA: HD domain-containing phosphohydrolase [Pseudomonadales bacterium]|nr:HD domain-containing phosphohydrolase [Pseudomonadales bacterium]